MNDVCVERYMHNKPILTVCIFFMNALTFDEPVEDCRHLVWKINLFISVKNIETSIILKTDNEHV